MFLVSLCRRALSLLVPLSFFLTTYLYLYPVFNLCAFPAPFPETTAGSAFLNTLRGHTPSSAYNASLKAPFRLLTLGDPQLEGDTSIDPNAATFPHWKKLWDDALLRNGAKHNLLQRVRHSLHDLVDFYFDDIPKALEAYRKRLDLLGNDFYLAHIHRTLHWWTKPTHVTVLGDLVGSQWIEDDEFNTRGWRYWNRVFKNGQRVPDDITAEHEDWNVVPNLSDDAEAWRARVINVAGNHDIGYAGDLTPERFERFERVFGRANYELRFQLPTKPIFDNLTSYDPIAETVEPDRPELRIIVLNDMNLDTPALSKPLQDVTYNFINKVINTSPVVTRKALFTLVLTHIPLHKETGICVDAPFFDFHESEEFAYGVREQNHLSLSASKGILEGIFGKNGNANADGRGLGRNGLILTGHDHEGCDTYHFINQSEPSEEREWQAARWRHAKRANLVGQEDMPGLREITVRSMMGEFGGNAGLLSLWFDPDTWEWRFEFDTCPLGVQHWWWAVHILDFITIGVLLTFCVFSAGQGVGFLSHEGIKSSSESRGAVRKMSKGGPGAATGYEIEIANGSLSKQSLKKRSKSSPNGTFKPIFKRLPSPASEDHVEDSSS